jgi:hypothetical protein
MFVLLVILLKVTNIIGITAISMVNNVPKLDWNFFSGPFTWIAIGLVLPAYNMRIKALKILSQKPKRYFIQEGVEKSDYANPDDPDRAQAKASLVFTNAWDIWKKRGLVEFIKQDPLEIKKALLIIGVIIAIIYLYNTL